MMGLCRSGGCGNRVVDLNVDEGERGFCSWCLLKMRERRAQIAGGILVGQASEVDLGVFDEVNDRPGRKMNWEDRVELIHRQFPSTKSLDWKVAFDRDFSLFADIMWDVLKADAAEPGRSGPKPGVDYRKGIKRFQQMMGDDYSMQPFQETFRILAGEVSLATLAVKIGIPKIRVHRLLQGLIRPTGSDMEKVARGFKKQPGHFLEYRRGVVIAAMAERLTDVPESSVKWFEAIQQGAA